MPQRGRPKQHARMRAVQYRRLDVGCEIFRIGAVGNGADEPNIRVQLPHVLDEIVGLQNGVRVLHQDRVVGRLREGRDKIVHLGAFGEFRGRAQKPRRDLRMTREDIPHRSRRLAVRVDGRGENVEIGIILGEYRFLRPIEIFLQHLDRHDDRNRRLFAVPCATRRDPRLRDGRQGRRNHGRDGNDPEGRAPPKRHVAQDVPHPHQTASFSFVLGTSAEKRSITASTQRGGKNVMKRSAHHMNSGKAITGLRRLRVGDFAGLPAFGRRRHWRRDEAGDDHADIDPMRRQHAPQRLGVGIDRRLARAISGRERQAAHAGHRADDGDRARASLRHRRYRGLDRVQDADHIDRQRRAHGLGIFQDLPGGEPRRDARVGIHDIERRERNRVRHGFGHAGAVLHVDDETRDIGALVAARFRGSFEPRFVAPEQREPRAVLRMAQRQRTAYAAGGPGNQNMLPAQVKPPGRRTSTRFLDANRPPFRLRRVGRP